MSIRPFRDINRNKTKEINVGNVLIGGNNPITVQSMTNTLTTDVKATIKQIDQIIEKGGDLVRVSVPDKESSNALKEITKHSAIPIIADVHYHYKRALEAADNGAKCLRINPGNIGDKNKIQEIIKAAKNNDCAIRVGVNAGSLEKDLLEKYYVFENNSKIKDLECWHQSSLHIPFVSGLLLSQYCKRTSISYLLNLPVVSM